MSVLVIGLANDPVVKNVLSALSRVDADVIHWTPRNLLNDCAFTAINGEIEGYLLVDDRTVSLSEITGVFNRFSNIEITPEYNKLSPNDPVAKHAITANGRLIQFCDIASCVVMNRSTSNDANSAKAYQAQLISPYFFVPDTRIANTPEAAMEFSENREKVIFKSCSGERSIVTELDLVDLLKKTESLRLCPVQFQEFIDGTDVRVHVVDEAIFATSVFSSSTDYRYDKSAEWTATEISPEVATACVQMAHDMDLRLAGIDLKFAIDGRVVCFEVNPSPAFSVYEDATGQRISDAVTMSLLGLS
jgi:glutathione synthase/RimK-type ligase-like ATP-grasp enzyme